jgi:hypothetical protein
MKRWHTQNYVTQIFATPTTYRKQWNIVLTLKLTEVRQFETRSLETCHIQHNAHKLTAGNNNFIPVCSESFVSNNDVIRRNLLIIHNTFKRRNSHTWHLHIAYLLPAINISVITLIKLTFLNVGDKCVCVYIYIHIYIYIYIYIHTHTHTHTCFTLETVHFFHRLDL